VVVKSGINLKLAPMLAAGALVAGTAPALAATPLGEVIPAGVASGGCTNCGQLQVSTAPGSAPYVVGLGGGVITSWTFHDVTAPTSAKLRLFAPGPGAGQYTLLAETPYRSFSAGETATTPTRIPVAAGVHLGVAVTAADQDYITGYAGDHVSSNFDVAAPIGASELVTTSDERHVNIAAVVEPDADHDGYGDDTQDKCPSDPSKQGTCSGAPPIPAAPKPPSVPSIPSSPATQTTVLTGASGPLVSLIAPRSESIKRRVVKVGITSVGDVTVSASGQVGAGKLRSVSQAIGAGKRITLKLTIPKRSLRAIRGRLAHHKKVSAKVTVAVNGAGGATTASLRIRLTR
jgi:hypothetical protein